MEPAALAPVREALLAAARADAAGIRAGAEERATQVVAAARKEADELREAARAQGAEDGTAALAAARTRARRLARAAVLRARSEAYEALRAGGRGAVVALTTDADYPRLRERLAAAARTAAGPESRVREADGGGVVAEAPGRRVDYSLAGFADRAVDTLAAELEEDA
jgi:vacuolar-type H+-ATPase subunit E/Vma4